MFQTESLLTKPAWKLSRKDYEALVQEHWERTRDLHFGSGGTPYWIERAAKYGVNPARNLATVKDFLNHEISLCEEDELRQKPLTYFIPETILSIERGKISPFTSSGTAGRKKPHAWSPEALDYCAMFYDYILDLYGVQRGLDWFSPGTYGLFEAIMRRVTSRRDGMFYFIPVELMDLKKHLAPLQVSDFGKAQSDPFLMARIGPALQQSFDMLSRGIDVFGTIIAFLPLFESSPGFERVKVVPVTLEVNEESFSYWKNRLGGRILYNTYGNSCAGLFPNIPGNELMYYPPSPISLIFVVDEDNPFDLAEYGERGQMRLLKMDKTFLWCQTERDYAERVAPRNEFKWDGVRNITTHYE